jgi:hypothetical protein
MYLICNAEILRVAQDDINNHRRDFTLILPAPSQIPLLFPAR